MKMPARFSRRWWKLWRSGAIDVAAVFFDECASQIERYQRDSRERGVKQGMGYFDNINTSLMRKGRAQWLPPSAIDALASVAQKCYIINLWGWSVYQALTDRLIANAEWHSKEPNKDYNGDAIDSFQVAHRNEARNNRSALAQRISNQSNR